MVSIFGSDAALVHCLPKAVSQPARWPAITPMGILIPWSSRTSSLRPTPMGIPGTPLALLQNRGSYTGSYAQVLVANPDGPGGKPGSNTPFHRRHLLHDYHRQGESDFPRG